MISDGYKSCITVQQIPRLLSSLRITVRVWCNHTTCNHFVDSGASHVRRQQQMSHWCEAITQLWWFSSPPDWGEASVWGQHFLSRESVFQYRIPLSIWHYGDFTKYFHKSNLRFNVENNGQTSIIGLFFLIQETDILGCKMTLSLFCLGTVHIVEFTFLLNCDLYKLFQML